MLSLPEMPKFAREMLEVPFWIGQFIMEWTKQELALAWLIADLEGGDHELIVDQLLHGPTRGYEKRLISAGMKFNSDHAVKPRIDEIIALHKSLRTIRHDIIHGRWGSMKDEEYLLRRKLKGKSEEIRPFTAWQLREQVNRINELVIMIVNARRVLRGEETI